MGGHLVHMLLSETGGRKRGHNLILVITRATLANAGISRRRVSVCLSVCLSNAGIVSKRRRMTQTTSRDRPGTFLRNQSLVGDTPFPTKLALKLTHPFRTPRFGPISARSAATMRASEEWSISTNRKSTTRFLTSHRWTVYVTPKSLKGWHKTRFCCFACKIH